MKSLLQACYPKGSLFRAILLIVFVLFFLASTKILSAQELDETAIITALSGSVSLTSSQDSKPLQPFTMLKKGDSLRLEGSALIKLIYFSNGRQEIWHGNGIVDILESEGKGSGLPVPHIITLSRQIVRQIAKTPAGDRIEKNRMRLRSVGPESSVDKIESSYRKMRMEADRGDLNPELYLLSALFEVREIERVEQVLADLRSSRSADQEARVVIALYQKAVKNFKESSGR